MMRDTIRGYIDRPSAKPGETISVHVSSRDAQYRASLVRLRQLDHAADGPGVKITKIDSVPERIVHGQRHRTQVGNYIKISPSPPLPESFTFFAFIQPLHLAAGRQAIASIWDENGKHGWTLEVVDGRLGMRIGDGHNVAFVQSDWPLFEGIWYGVAGSWDAQNHVVHIAQQSLVTSTNSRFGCVVPLDSSGITTVQTTNGLNPAKTPMLIAGLPEDGACSHVLACFNGKIDAPRLHAGIMTPKLLVDWTSGLQRTEGVIAHWDFSIGIGQNGITTDQASDISGNGHHGHCINQPTRAVTGWNWTGRKDLFINAPEQYGAILFHEDALDDCRWPADFEIRLPDDLPSGCYAVHVEQDEKEDYIPFFVRPADSVGRAKIAVLMPTLTYLIYANFHLLAPWKGWGYNPYGTALMPLGERDIEMMEAADDYGRSPYDYHADGYGVHHASWRRPILNMRPRQAFSFNYQADFYLIDWLEHHGFEYDVITDHDLHQEGQALLQPYRVVMTGSHPEYYTWEMLDALEEYFSHGGRGMYLGGNGFYWVTAIHSEKPWLAEVRRGDSGDSAWHSRPGEYYHAFTGERGGLWRYRGRAPQKLCGTGYSASTLGVSGYYIRMPDSHDARVAWMFEGIATDEKIGETGLVGGAAAGIELDSYDISLGTPPNTLLLGSSVCHDQYAMLVPEEVANAHPCVINDEHPKIRADITYFTTNMGGAVFASSAIGWTGALVVDDYRSTASRLTLNVLRRFVEDTPLEAITEEI